MEKLNVDKTKPNIITLPNGWRQVSRFTSLLQIAPINYIGQDTWHLAVFASDHSVEEWARELLGEAAVGGELTKCGRATLLHITTVHAYTTDDHYLVSNDSTVLYAHARSFTPQNKHAAHSEFAELIKNANFAAR